MGRTETFSAMKDEAIEAIGEALVERAKHARAASRARVRLGEANERLTALMKEHKRKTYVDQETGTTVTLSNQEVLVVKSAKQEKADEEAEGKE